MQAATIKIFLAHGSPTGLRTAEISNWSGKAITAPRTEFSSLLKREELANPGIYFLTGVDPDTGDDAIYIGEAEKVAGRIKGHANKDFWNSVVVFVSKDENLTKAHTRYLEGKLIEMAQEIGASKVINSQTSGARLPESDSADMDIFLEKCLQLLPVLGVNSFKATVDKATEEEDILYCKIKGLTAKGKRTSSGFVVFSGSKAVLEHRPSSTRFKAKREELMEKGILEKQNNHLVFTKDVEFGSPSTAASIVRGGNSNGLTSWKDANGKKLGQIEEEKT